MPRKARKAQSITEETKRIKKMILEAKVTGKKTSMKMTMMKTLPKRARQDTVAERKAVKAKRKRVSNIFEIISYLFGRQEARKKEGRCKQVLRIGSRRSFRRVL